MAQESTPRHRIAAAVHRVAEPAVIAACGDEHWRVREMAAKVLATRPVASAGAEQALETLVCDGNQRVAAAASRALRS